MNISLSRFAIEKWVSRDGFGGLVPRELTRTYGIPTDFRGGVHIFIKTAIRYRASPEFMGSRNCVPMR